MNFKPLLHSGLVQYLMSLFISMALLAPISEALAVQTTEVIVEDPQLHPAATTCPQTYWYPFDNNRGHTAYLTLNTNDPLHSTNHAEWYPVIPQAGYYRVEAYIAGHNPITWCTGEGRVIDHDTTDAHYSIHHAYGVSTRSLSQNPLSNQWLDLGEYYFNVGNSGYISLADLNGEPEYSTTVSFSAMRFTFTRLSGPRLYLPLVHHDDPSGRPPPDAGVIQAQGFDACHLPTISEMQTWWSQSPYSFYALYIGGIQLYSGCAVANSSWVSAVHQQGWSFVPTWVGPQAPCSMWSHKMSADPAVSYQEGRQEAQTASAAAASIGLTNYGLGGTVIYYDLEAYGVSTPECRLPVSAFMNGWVERLHELGNLAGGYGTRNSYPWDWATIPNIPDDVWPASWYTDRYDPYASIYGISWLDGLWTNHQRIRQYAGDHNERWGVVEFNIDSDVADG
ncbi:MAG: glycoside hydrolase domain-containing protein, partial [Anaerolineales bacterium]